MRMFSFRGKSAPTVRTGLVHSQAQRAAAIVSRRAGQTPQLVHVETEGRTKGVLPWKATQELLAKLPRKNSRVAAVLDSSSYQMLLIEPPAVPDADVRAAVRWKIRDQVPFAIDSAVIDVFALPAARNSPGLMQVVVVAPNEIDELVAIVDGAHRTVDVIDVPELALRNVMTLLPQDLSGCLFVLLGRSTVNILISCLGVLYVVRRIDAGLGTDIEQLAVEVQRSMQYYESQFDRPPINEIVIGPANDRARELAPQLADACGVVCQVLELKQVLPMAPDVGAVDQPELLLAIGAALRPGHVGVAS